MSAHPLAGKPAPKDLLIDVNKLEEAFYASKPDPADVNQLVSFGTSPKISEKPIRSALTTSGSQFRHRCTRFFATEAHGAAA
jgi:hypothetical protein